MISSKQNKQAGFTIVELIIVIVVIGILALITITAFSGVTQRARNSEREADIKAIHSSLEYFASTTGNGNYPTEANLEDGTWLTANMAGLDREALRDPSSAAGTFTLASAAPTAVGLYAYVPTPAACTGATGATPCTGYTVSAFRENGSGVFSKTDLQ